MTKSKIRKGKIVRNSCTLVAVLLVIIGEVINKVYIENIKNNLEGSDKLLYEMVSYKFPTSDIAVYTLIAGAIIFIIGCIVSSVMCKCNNCGETVISRYGTVYEHCPKCGKEVDLDIK